MMEVRITSLVRPFLLVLLCCTAVLVQAGDQAGFLTRLHSIQAMSGSFQQEILSSSGELIDRQQGSFSMQRPRLIYWQVERPRQLLVCDGERIFVYDPDLEQVIVQPWTDDPARNPASLFTTEVDLAEHFVIRSQGQSYLLRPLDPTSLISEIRVDFDADDLLGGFSITDSSGQLTRIEFQLEQVNLPRPADYFQFVIPAGADVIFDE